MVSSTCRHGTQDRIGQRCAGGRARPSPRSRRPDWPDRLRPGATRIAEGRRGIDGSLAFPVTEPSLFDLTASSFAIDVADHGDHGVFGPVPAVVEGLRRSCPRAARSVLPSRSALRVASGWPAKSVSRVVFPTRSAGPPPSRFSASTIGTSVAHVLRAQDGCADHAREQLHALVQLGRGRLPGKSSL